MPGSMASEGKPSPKARIVTQKHIVVKHPTSSSKRSSTKPSHLKSIIKSSKGPSYPKELHPSWNDYVYDPNVKIHKKPKTAIWCYHVSKVMRSTPACSRRKGYEHDYEIKSLNKEKETARCISKAIALGKAMGTIIKAPAMAGNGSVLWLMDTGTPFDIISKYDVSSNERAKKKRAKHSIILNTANGIVKVKWQVPLKVKLSRSQTENIDAIMMNGATPAALSIGRRCMENGYTFIWKPYSNPRLVDSKGREIPLLVDNFCPYLRNGSATSMAAKPLRGPQTVDTNRRKAAAPSGGKPLPDDVDSADAPPPPPEMEAGVERKHRDPRAEAKSAEHMMCHFPKNPHCPTCQRAKMMQKPARKTNKTIDSKPQEFGQLVTADTIIANRDVDRGINGETCALVILDVATDFIECHPMKKKTADAAYSAMDEFEGPNRVVMRFHSDNAPELIKAAKMIGWRHTRSTPGVHESNAIAESAVRRVLNGTRAILDGAGFEPKWWPYACRCYCFLHNTAMRNGDSPWNKRHGKGHYSGVRVPFGSLVNYVPNPDDRETLKWGCSGIPGVLLYYDTNSSDVFKGDSFAVARLDELASDKEIKIRKSRKILLDDKDKKKTVFPCKARYDLAHTRVNPST